MLNIIVDVFIILFIMLLSYIGYKKGLIEVAFKLLSFFIAIIISIILFKPVSYCIINMTPIDNNVNSYVYNLVDSHISEKSDNKEDKTSKLPKSLSRYIDKNIEEAKETIKENIVKTVAENITSTIINILAFLIVFIVTRIVLIFVHFLSDTLAELPIIKQFNETGGILYGLLKSMIIIFTVLAIISILPFDNIKQIISSTYVTLFLYNINPILWVML